MHKKPIILLIEDNPTTHQAFLKALEDHNYKVVSARTGNAAISELDTNTPNLILQDLCLPDIGYNELISRIRAHKHGKSAPIIGLAGFLNKPDQHHFNEDFANILIKPIDIPHLLNTAKSYLPNLVPTHLKKGWPKRVLLVDDNRSHLKLWQLHLANNGFTVDLAENGKQALERINKNIPDVIVSDVLMPVMSGFELCMCVRRIKSLENIPIILMTSQYLDEGDRALGQRVGANYYITRATEPGQLIKLINNCIKSKIECNESIVNENIHALEEENTHRLIRQLETQISAKDDLAKRCALQFAHLTMLGDMANALVTSNKIETTLANVLSTCLDAAGISNGAIFLFDQYGRIDLKQLAGYTHQEQECLIQFMSNPSMYTLLDKKRDIITIPSNIIHSSIADKLLHDTGMNIAIIAPFFCGGAIAGTVVLGAKAIKVDTNDIITFTRSLAAQIGQTVALAKSFERVSDSEQRYRILMNNARCGIFILDSHGKILETNEQTENMLECEKDELLNCQFTDFIPDSDKASARESIQALTSGEVIDNAYIKIISKNKIKRSIEYSGVKVKAGTESLIMIVTTDVTERDRLKSKSILNDKLATVGTLAAGVAHEINNPITWVMNNLSQIKSSVSSYAEFIKNINSIAHENDHHEKIRLIDNLIASLNPSAAALEMDELLSDSLQGVARVRDIVKNLKEFSRIDSSDKSLVDVHKILDSSINMAELDFKNKAKLEKNYTKDIPCIMVNSGKLQQVFLNLIINASQAMPDKNTKNNIIVINTSMEESYISISIADNGNGIPPEMMAHIFDPFFTTKAVGQGTGLGLSICQEIVTQLGGHISVKSKPGKGSTFTVFLPTTSENDPKKHPLVPDTDKKNILIVDDEPFLVKSLLNTLTNRYAGYNVVTAPNGRLASEKLKHYEGKFHSIICDLQMPDMNGCDLYHHIVEHYPWLRSCIIFITGGSYTPKLKEFLQNINNTVLEKPFTQEALFQVIESCFLSTITSESGAKHKTLAHSKITT